MSAAVEATGFAKRYGSLVALEDLIFEAQAGGRRSQVCAPCTYGRWLET